MQLTPDFDLFWSYMKAVSQISIRCWIGQVPVTSGFIHQLICNNRCNWTQLWMFCLKSTNLLDFTNAENGTSERAWPITAYGKNGIIRICKKLETVWYSLRSEFEFFLPTFKPQMFEFAIAQRSPKDHSPAALWAVTDLDATTTHFNYACADRYGNKQFLQPVDEKKYCYDFYRTGHWVCVFRCVCISWLAWDASLAYWSQDLNLWSDRRCGSP